MSKRRIPTSFWNGVAAVFFWLVIIALVLKVMVWAAVILIGLSLLVWVGKRLLPSSSGTD